MEHIFKVYVKETVFTQVDDLVESKENSFQFDCPQNDTKLTFPDPLTLLLHAGYAVKECSAISFSVSKNEKSNTIESYELGCKHVFMDVIRVVNITVLPESLTK